MGKAGTVFQRAGFPNNYLSRFFTVLLHENYYTSQASLFGFLFAARPFESNKLSLASSFIRSDLDNLVQTCPTCLGELVPYPLRDKDEFHKVCKNCKGHSKHLPADLKSGRPDIPEGKLVVEKNVTAALCMARIFLYILATGDRQDVFCNEQELEEAKRRRKESAQSSR